MKPTIIPAATDIGREALIVIGGALLAALIIGKLMPEPVRAWIKKQWADTPNPLNPF